MRKPDGLTQLNTRVAGDLIDELDRFCDDKKLYKKNVIELAIRRFLSAEKSKCGKSPS
jgi:hypothetical protein